MYFQISLLQETTVLVVKMDARQILLQKQNFSSTKIQIQRKRMRKRKIGGSTTVTYYIDLRKWRPRCDVLETVIGL